MIKEKNIAKILTAKKLTLSIAESCTGGLLSNRLTNIPGSSKYFKAGFIVYSNEAKIKLLKVPPIILEKYGAVSKECAISMAKNVRKLTKADIGIAITGIAGPSGGSILKPVGLVFIAVYFKNKIICEKFKFSGKRLEIKKKSADKALELLQICLTK